MQKSIKAYKIQLLAGLQLLNVEFIVEDLGEINLAQELQADGWELDLSENKKIWTACSLIVNSLKQVFYSDLSNEQKAHVGTCVWNAVKDCTKIAKECELDIFRYYILLIMQPVVPVLKMQLAEAGQKVFASFAAGGVAQLEGLENATPIKKIERLWEVTSPECGLAYLDYCLEYEVLPNDESWFEELFEVAGNVGGDKLQKQFTEHQLTRIM